MAFGTVYRVHVELEKCNAEQDLYETIGDYQLAKFDSEKEAVAFVEEVLTSELTREGYNHARPA